MIIRSNPTKILVVISVLLMAGAALVQEPNAIAQTAIAQTARIEKVIGQVRLKRKNWLDYRLVRAGAPLEQGDLLFPATGSQSQSYMSRSVKAICQSWCQFRA